jgi:transposase InsO family protein
LRRPREPAQFAFWALTQSARDSGLAASMGSVGDCYDTSMIEAFWSRMQVELLDLHRWRTRVELASALPVGFTGTSRVAHRQLSLGRILVEVGGGLEGEQVGVQPPPWP